MNSVETSTIGVEAFKCRVGWHWSFCSTSLFQTAVLCHGIAQNATVQRMELTDVISLSDWNFQQPRKSPVETSTIENRSVRAHDWPVLVLPFHQLCPKSCDLTRP
jgi:hypothetical protein